MNDYASRSELSPVDRAVTRAPAAVSAVQPVGTPGGGGSSLQTASSQSKPAKADIPGAGLNEDQLASAAEYASVHARIADILADLRSTNNAATASVGGAEAAITAMLPAPIIIVPMAPASREQVERAAQLAKSMVERASHAHAAQAHVRPGTADQILATVA